MLSAFRNAFKIPELRGKILFTVAIIAVYRLGSHLPVPGVDFVEVVAEDLRWADMGNVLLARPGNSTGVSLSGASTGMADRL